MASPESIQAASLVHKMMYEDNSIVKPNEKVDFTSGNVGMTMRQLSWLSSLKDVGFTWDFAPLPSGPVGPNAVVGQAAVVVFNTSPNKDVAVDFFKIPYEHRKQCKALSIFPASPSYCFGLWLY